MAISKNVIKIMGSENLTDFTDGGGMMSGNEIVSGNVNNLFPDISPLDRALGRVSLRKCYAIALTDDNDTYQGCHVILSDPPDDPLVSVSLFTTKSHFDFREDARDRIESYVVQGTKYAGYLLGNQLEGSRAIQIVQRETVALPRVGDVLFLIENAGTALAYFQYVRITDISHETRIFSVSIGSTYTDIQRRVVTCEIGDALRKTYHGAEPNYTDSHGQAVPYNTMVADAAKYYGVKKVVADIAAGTFVVKADSIFNHLVPSAQAESPVIDITAAGAVAGTKKSGSAISFSVSLNVSKGTRMYCGTGIVRGSLSVVNGGSTWTDDRKGNLVRSGTVEGTVEYGTGIVTFQISGISGTFNASYVPAVQTHGINRTYGLNVTLASRSYNYTATLIPKPEPGTLTVDYMSQGNWYRLQDNGAGELLPLIPNTGSGTLNLETGSCIMTCGALPDVDSTILYSWSADVEYKEPVSTVVNNAFRHVFTLPKAPVEPGSVSFSFDGVLVSDNGSGGLQGANGTIDYISGRIEIIPTFLKPTAGVDLTINPDYRAPSDSVQRKAGSFSVIAGPSNTFADIDATRADTLVISGVQFEDSSGRFVTVDVKDAGGTLKTVSGAEARFENGALSIPAGTVVGTFGAANGDILIQGTVTGKTRSSTPTYIYIDGKAVPNGVSVYSGDVTLKAKAGSVSYSAYAADAVYSDTSGVVPKNTTTATLSGSVDGALVADAVSINIGANNVIVKNGVLYKDYNRANDTGIIIGSLSASGEIILTAPFVTDVPNTIVFKSLVSKISDQYVTEVVFRTPGAPLRPGSFYIQAKRMKDGVVINATANLTGAISATEIKGKLNHETGVAGVSFGKWVSPASSYVNEPWYSADAVVNDSIWMPIPVIADSIRYNCVVYGYLPLDAELIGLDPVRLPQDGRVPVFRKGDLVVVHHTLQTPLPSGLTAGQQIQLPRDDLTLVELYDSDGLYVPETNYSVNLASGLVTMANPLNLTGFVQPLAALHRREEMSLASDVQINGMITVTKPFKRDYPANETMVSAALAFGDLQSRVYNVFDQKTWGNVWSDDRIGDAATATYNKLNYPIVTTNRGAIPQKWAIVFDAPDHFKVMGEDIGVIFEGYITQDCSPINPATNAPYFTIKYNGWGSGWVAGNALRFNTMAASAPLWINRTTLQGEATETEDEFRIHIRGAGN